LLYTNCLCRVAQCTWGNTASKYVVTVLSAVLHMCYSIYIYYTARHTVLLPYTSTCSTSSFRTKLTHTSSRSKHIVLLFTPSTQTDMCKTPLLLLTSHNNNYTTHTTVGPYMQASGELAGTPRGGGGPGDTSFFKGTLDLQQHILLADLSGAVGAPIPLPISLGLCCSVGTLRMLPTIVSSSTTSSSVDRSSRKSRINDRFFLGTSYTAVTNRIVHDVNTYLRIHTVPARTCAYILCKHILAHILRKCVCVLC
jgi:hypothetical protein